MQSNYLLECSDDLALSKKITEIIKKQGFEGQYQATYDLEESSLELALEDLDTYSFLSDKKIIIIRNAFLNASEKELNHLQKYIDNSNPDNLLIITSNKLDSRLTFIKNIKKNKNIEYLKIEMNPEKFVKEKLSGYEISTSDINHLIDLCKEDITKLDSECDKLQIYRFDTKKISREDIDLLVVEKLGNSSEVLYSMTNSIISKDKRKALQDYEKLKKYQMDVYSIIGLLASQIRLIHQVKILKNRGLSNQEIASSLGVKSTYQIKKMAEYGVLYSNKDIYEFTHLLADIDLKIKTGKIDQSVAIESLIISQKN